MTEYEEAERSDAEEAEAGNGRLECRSALRLAYRSVCWWEMENQRSAASDVEVARMLAGWKADRTSSLNAVLGGCESQLRDDLEPKRAGAIIRALTGAEVFSELVRAEGWAPDEYEAWLSGLLVDLLVKRPTTLVVRND